LCFKEKKIKAGGRKLDKFSFKGGGNHTKSHREGKMLSSKMKKMLRGC